MKNQRPQLPREGDDESNRLIKRFLKKIRNEGILQELYDRRHFEKPSVKRRKKSSRARFNRNLAEKKK